MAACTSRRPFLNSALYHSINPGSASAGKAHALVARFEPRFDTAILFFLALLVGESDLAFFVDRYGRRYECQRAHALRIRCRESHADHAAHRLTAKMNRRATQVFDQRPRIVDACFESEFSCKVEVCGRQAESANVRTHDFIETAQVRNPAVPELTRTAVAVLENEIRRVFPGIGEIVDDVVQIGFVRTFYVRHGGATVGYRMQRDASYLMT